MVEWWAIDTAFDSRFNEDTLRQKHPDFFNDYFVGNPPEEEMVLMVKKILENEIQYEKDCDDIDFCV